MRTRCSKEKLAMKISNQLTANVKMLRLIKLIFVSKDYKQ